MYEEDIKISIPIALQSGYRLFDTATIYRNEGFLGTTLKHTMGLLGLKREDIFVTSKLQPQDQGYELAQAAIKKSIEFLGLDYIDLYLVHWPGVSGMAPSDPQQKLLREGSWRALEEALASGIIHSIGISNYSKSHLEEMKGYAKEMPHVHQFELHPLYYPKDIIEFCNLNGIFVQSYSSLGRGKLIEPSFFNSHPLISNMMSSHNVTASQIMLKWALQNGFGILPKSITPQRIRDNIDLYSFELTEDEIFYLNNLHKEESCKICWDPSIIL